MPTIGQPYTKGTWTVREGSEEEFVERWKELIGSAREVPGAESFLLIQERNDPRRFVSFGAWSDWESADAWRAGPAFTEAMRACLELCEDFQPGDSTLRAAVPT